MAAVSPARKAAFAILLAVERGEAHSDDLLRSRKVDALSAPDRHLATALVLGVLRWQMVLDRAAQAHLAKPNAKLDVEVRIALRMGVFQLLFLDRIPAHAALDESVELVKRAGHRFAAGMVNAVLRRVSQADLPRQSRDELALAMAAHPAWMTACWSERYGAEAAGAICRHGQEPPALAIRLAGPAAEAELQGQGIELAPGALLSCARTVLSGDVAATAAFASGRVRIQDEGSQLVGEIAAFAAPRSASGRRRILDACAAPGGKTAILAERDPQARIVACEASAQRLEAMRARLAAYADRVEFRSADASALTEDSVYDLALADVPCSGTGTLGRNPEIRHRLGPGDLSRQAERQRGILRAVLRAVRPGGRVVYATCSLEPEENEAVIAAALEDNRTARRVPVADVLHAMQRAGALSAARPTALTGGAAERLGACLAPEGALRLLPGVIGTDGFFVAVLERLS